MAEGPSAYDMFNRALSDFLADLRPILGHLPEYAVATSSAKWVAQFAERRNQELFDALVAAKFDDHIERRDDALFMQDEYLESGAGVDMVQLLKNVWSSLAESDRNAVWTHMQVLSVLNKRCKAAKTMARAVIV